MKIVKENKSKNVITFEIEEDYSKVASAMDVAFKEMVKTAKIPGFRQGKIPRSIFEKHYGKEVLLEKAVNNVMNDTYPLLITEKGLEPIDYPSDIKILKIEENNPLVFSLSVPVKPDVKMGKYKGLKIKKVDEALSDKEYTDKINEVLDKYATYELVTDKPSKKDDIVSYSIKATADGEEVPEWTKETSGTKIGTAVISEDFDANITGVKAGETKKFTISFPQDYNYEIAAGKKVDFEITMVEIREKVMPELNEEFVKKISQYDSVEEYEKNFRENLEKQKKQEAQTSMKEELLEQIIDDMKVEVPDVMVEKEIDSIMHRLEHSMRSSGITLEQYVQLTGKSMSSLRADYRENALKKVKVDLAVEVIEKLENIKVSDEDIEAEYKKLAESYKTDVETIKKNLTADYDKYIRSYLTYDKTIDFLMEHAKIK